MKFTMWSVSSKLQESKIKHIQSRVQAIAVLPNVTLAMVNEMQVFAEQICEVEKATMSLFDRFLQQEQLPPDYEEQVFFDFHTNFSALISDTRSVTLAFLANHVDLAAPTAVVSHMNVKLPKLNLPLFSGKWEEWPTFSQLYQATIHDNQALAEVEKFQYLVGCLIGEASQLVKNLPITSENYPVAWELLTSQYQNHRKLATMYINRLFELPTVNCSHLKSLQNFVTGFNENARALDALGHSVTKGNPVLLVILMKKLDVSLRTKFEHSCSKDKDSFPEVIELMEFLQKESVKMDSALDVGSKSVQSAVSPKPNVTQLKPPNLTSQKLVFVTNALSSTRSCILCKHTTHSIYVCPQFLEASITARQQIVKDKKLCFNCLGVAHRLAECSSLNSCAKCSQRHHTLLHYETSDVSNQPQISDHKKMADTQFVGLSAHECRTTVLLATALVRVYGADGNNHVMRCLLDNAAQASFITESASQLLSLPRRRVVERISGLSTSAVHLKGVLDCRMQSIAQPKFEINHSLFIVSKITNDLPRAAVDSSIRTKLGSLSLADPYFDKPAPIDILLGADVYAHSCMSGRLELGNELPVVLESKFGWVLIGECPESHPFVTSTQESVSMFVGMDQPLDSMLKRFWECEEPPHTHVKSPDDVYCESYFVNTHSRETSGRYKVRLPVAPHSQSLGNSRIQAEKRFYSLEKRLACHSQLDTLYKEFMQDYVESGHMERYMSDSVGGSKISECYIPHHGVIKDSSSTTKLRVVFDGSAKTSNGLALNDILLPGPKLQNEITDVVLRFRLYSVVFTCDIKQMYRQILLHENDRPYQLILWRDHPSQPLSEYQLNTVTYGLSPSPFLAIRTLQQLAADDGHLYPLAENALLHHIFVDDIITGAATVEEACLLRDQLLQLLHSGGFELRKWSSNQPKVLEKLPPSHCENPRVLEFSSGSVINVLGLQWDPKYDTFSYDLNVGSGDATKRFVLSQIARIYDPMGWLSPIVIWAKILMQWLWVQGLDWDELLPPQVLTPWNKFLESLCLVKNLQLPSYICSGAMSVELHGFSDASEKAYAAAIYVKSADMDGKVSVHLVMAKSKVSPLKQVSLPRLELCSAHLLAKLLDYCLKFLSQYLNIISFLAWSDSSVTLAWIKTPPYLLKTFIANRVAQIQEWVPPQQWRHVRSKDNPADCASRGILPQELVSHNLWWHGPQWLASPPTDWPQSSVPVAPDEVPELKPSTVTLLAARVPYEELQILQHPPAWPKLVRIMAYFIRFTKCTRQQTGCHGPLSFRELQQSTQVICKSIQHVNFQSDLYSLKQKEVCSTRLQRLSPFLDDDGLLRVGGRLKNSTLKYSTKHPILLPKGHPVVATLVDHYHLKYLHAAPQLLQSLISQHFWILSARCLIRSRVFKCIRCFRCKPVNQLPLMGDLPSTRITPTRAFEQTGVDYAGPISIRLHGLRRCPLQKAYLSIFICFVTKAVHIEVVTDLTADSFIAALSRFVSRRGLCAALYSDCGTNFVGASRQLTQIFGDLLKSTSVQDFALAHSIEFHFLPPASPHQGGLWEAAVKSAKYHLRRVIGDQVLTFEELTTLCARVEAVLNSRPLTPLSSDPRDLSALTPGHFLIGAPLVAIPEPGEDDQTICISRRWKMVCTLATHFWARWYREYLQQMQPRGKWITQKPGLSVGDLVLIGEERVPPQGWCLARVMKVHPGKDGVVRVATVRTQKGELCRPVHKLYKLPVQ